MIGVAVRLAEMRKPVPGLREEGRLIGREDMGVGVETVWVSADVVDVDDRASPLPAKAMALGAELCIDRLATGRTGGINGVGIFRWREGPYPVADPFDVVMVDRHGRDPSAEGRAQVAFVHGTIIAIPMKLHPFPRLLIPQRWKIGRADQL